MRILQISPGTGNFYCGSCIRDNTLVVTLRSMGHDVIMCPMYLPFMVDDANTSSKDLLFFGGINVYLQQKIPFFRRTPRWLDRILDSPSLLRFTARQAGMTKASELGEMTISMLNGEQGKQKKELDRLIEWLKSEEPYDLISLSNCMLMGLAEVIEKELNVPIACTLQGEDTFLDSLPEPYRDSAWRRLREIVPKIACFTPVSHYYGNVMKERLEIPQEKIHVVQNGISLKGFEQKREKSNKRVIGYLARLCETKGLHQLVQTFIQLKKQPQYEDVTLKIAGTMTPSDEPFVNGLKEQLKQEGLSDSVHFFPNINREDKIDFLKSLSLFSVPATYGETFGLYILEALAAGVPVVQPRHAGFVEIVESTGGGLLYRHDDPNDYLQSLQQMLDNRDRAYEIGHKGREEVFRHFHIERMAREIATIYESLKRPDANLAMKEELDGIGV